MNNCHKRSANINIDIGLSVLCAVSQRGDVLTIDDIADVCECSRNSIILLEKKALKKLKKKLNRDDFLGH